MGWKERIGSCRDGCRKLSDESRDSQADKMDERKPREGTVEWELVVQAAEGIQKKKPVRRKGLAGCGVIEQEHLDVDE